ncbi:MAG TPA: tetratricopeptide repeat protein, partial [Stellaceae bacterium]|nr:tetratricopeptide repeat protein [Stellaceae bacterium]
MAETPGKPGPSVARTLRQAVEAHRKGDLTAAESGYARILEAFPENFGALHMLGVVRNQQGLHEEAVALIGAALQQDGRSPEAHCNLGISLAALGRHAEAAEHFESAIAVNPDYADAHVGIGNARQALRQYDRAIMSYQRALAIDPNLVAAHNNLGNALRAAGRLAEAVTSLERALALKPDLADAHNNLGNALQSLKRLEDSVSHYEEAIRLNPGLVEAYSNLGNALRALDRHEEALARYQQAIAVRSSYAEAHFNLGSALTALNRHDEAIASLRRALAINPDMAIAYTNLGSVLFKLGRYEEAVAQCRTAVAIDPESAGAHNNLGNALAKLRRLDEALLCYRRAIELEPGQMNARGIAFELSRLMANWSESEADRRALVDGVASGELATTPFGIVTSMDDPGLQLRAARGFVDKEGLANRLALAAARRYRHDRIRIAYLSADFREHATAFLMAELFERHDRLRFDLFAISWGADDGSSLRRRLERSFDRFIDVRDSSDPDVAREMQELEIDIAVDLNGFVEGCRPHILARRPAPIQVNYLGFPGTMGADYIDYILADPFIVGADQQAFFTEKLVFLPECYQPNDRLRPIAERTPSRRECGLPDRAFVFACLNSPYKITPDVFDVWMRLLRSVPGAVLWLLSDNAWQESNLSREAQARGISPDRLVFAPRLYLPNHLARHRLADLFLDTFPCNAHTTASDALWAGLPLLTCMGRSFAARVAGSLLHAVGLPELVTGSLGDYEALALELARSPERLAALRARLQANRATAPL